MSAESHTPNALLSPEERERFAAWLEADAATDDALLQQMESMDGGRWSGMVWAQMCGSRRQDADAKRRVAALLRATESVTT